MPSSATTTGSTSRIGTSTAMVSVMTSMASGTRFCVSWNSTFPSSWRSRGASSGISPVTPARKSVGRFESPRAIVTPTTSKADSTSNSAGLPAPNSRTVFPSDRSASASDAAGRMSNPSGGTPVSRGASVRLRKSVQGIPPAPTTYVPESQPRWDQRARMSASVTSTSAGTRSAPARSHSTTRTPAGPRKRRSTRAAPPTSDSMMRSYSCATFPASPSPREMSGSSLAGQNATTVEASGRNPAERTKRTVLASSARPAPRGSNRAERAVMRRAPPRQRGPSDDRAHRISARTCAWRP